ncbi:MAG TPA: hypothetical protein VFK92_11615 [Burkholderiales bacterium]|nr:hypothetical protein [Burkholderiales bacterium]
MAKRARASKVRSHAARLRRPIVAGVDACLRRGVAACGRLSPRAAEQLETFAAWVRRSDARRLGIAALASLAVLAACSALLHEYFRAAFSSQPPLAEHTRRAVRDKADQLTRAIESRLVANGRLEGDAWTSAQMLVALKENNAGYRSRAGRKSIERYFRSAAGPECACWRKSPAGNFPSHLGVTSWALWVLACYGIPAHRTEIEFLLSAQGPEGAWPLFAGAEPKRFASSYATAAAILALHEQSAREKDPARRERIAAAQRRGADWLKTRAAPGRARWADYPDWPEERRDYLGLSGFVLFALHRTGTPGLAALDREWVSDLPDEMPALLADEASGRKVQVGTRFYPDDTLYRALPWTIVATVNAYPNVSIIGKVRAARWLERALSPGAPVYALAGSEPDAAMLAEALFALRSET